jgi:FAD/FMN-containing dehydrogenase
MTRFNETTVDPTSKTVAIGAGLTWDQVFATLEPAGVTVIGARVTGVGVAGSILGGGGRIPSSESMIS